MLERILAGGDLDADRRPARGQARRARAASAPAKRRPRPDAGTARRRRASVHVIFGEAAVAPERHQMSIPAVERAQMDAAFGLGAAAPAPGARVLAGLDRAGAGQAADRGIALGDERMRRQTPPCLI